MAFIALTAVSLCALASGTNTLVTGRSPSDRVVEPGQIRRFGVGLVLFGVFWALQAVGYFGVRLDLFSSSVRGYLFLVALAVGAVGLKYLPLSTWARPDPGDDEPDRNVVTRREYPYWRYVVALLPLAFVSAFVLGWFGAPEAVTILVSIALAAAALLPLWGSPTIRKWLRR